MLKPNQTTSHRLIFTALVRLAIAVAFAVTFAATAYAQDNSNVLGLPAVPQKPLASPAAGASAAQKTGPPDRLIKPTDAEFKSVLSGTINAASYYQDGLITVRVSTEKTFVGVAERAQAIQAARLLQRDVRLACGKLCKPAPMPTPEFKADNTLSFALVVSGFSGKMTSQDMVNLVSGKRISPGTQISPAAEVGAPAASAAPASAAATP